MLPRPICSYLLPFRRATFAESEAAELTRYFKRLGAAGCEVVVIDGSPDPVFARNARVFGASCRHEPVDRRFSYLNDKVNGVHSGVALASCDKIILADDDIRYRPETIAEIVSLLERYEVVRPQNFLEPLPWWARMEAARMLINRATLRSGDYPGTCAFRRSTFLRVGHYDGDVLFDNEEIIRHFADKGATIDYEIDLFVQKRPPLFQKWKEQRPRQAYEDFGLRTKTCLFLSIPPLLVVTGLLFGIQAVIACLTLVGLSSFSLALLGWSRGQARDVVPLSTCLFAPSWVAERSMSTYAAMYWYLARGGYPFGEKLLSKGIGRAWRNGGRVATRQLRKL